MGSLGSNDNKEIAMIAVNAPPICLFLLGNRESMKTQEIQIKIINNYILSVCDSFMELKKCEENENVLVMQSLIMVKHYTQNRFYKLYIYTMKNTVLSLIFATTYMCVCVCVFICVYVVV